MWLKFIKYNNLFPIILMAVFLGSGLTLAASPVIREGLISSQETVHSADNSYIIAINLDNYDFHLKINNVTEDALNYYVDYTYRPITLNDYVWQEVTRQKNLVVAKIALGDRDLGGLVSEQLGQMIDSELNYLREVQKIEIAKGQTQKVVSTKYAGLIGGLLSSSDKVFADYVPVVQERPESDQLAAIVIAEQPESERSKSIPANQVWQAPPSPEQQRENIQQAVDEIINHDQPEAETPVVLPTATSSDTGPIATSTPETAISTSTPEMIVPPADNANSPAPEASAPEPVVVLPVD